MNVAVLVWLVFAHGQILKVRNWQR